MKRFKQSGIASSFLAMLCAMTPANCSATEVTAPAVHLAPAVADVALRRNGTLVGQVVMAHGGPKVNARVQLVCNGQALGFATTDALGRFAVSGLNGGLYTLQCGETVRHCRIWQTEAAPPSSTESILLCCSDTVRGQNPVNSLSTMAALGMSITALTLSIVLPIALQDKDDGS